MKKKVCRKCKLFVEKDVCPNCNNTEFSENWKGRIIMIDADKSEIAKKINAKIKGEYAIRI